MFRTRRRSLALLVAPVVLSSLLLLGCTASPPAGVVATPGDGSVFVRFSADSLDFDHEIRSTPGDHIVQTSGEAAYVRGLENGTAYTFSVRSRGNDRYWSEWSAPSAPVVPTGKPAAPTITRVAGFVDLETGCTARVTFSPGPDGGLPITGYEVAVAGGPESVRGTTSPIEVPGLNAHTPYDFTVRAFNDRGASASSETFTGRCS